MTSQIKRQKLYKNHEKSVKQILLDIQNKMQFNNDNDVLSNDTFLKETKINNKYKLKQKSIQKMSGSKGKGQMSDLVIKVKSCI